MLSWPPRFYQVSVQVSDARRTGHGSGKLSVCLLGHQADARSASLRRLACTYLGLVWGSTWGFGTNIISRSRSALQDRTMLFISSISTFLSYISSQPLCSTPVQRLQVRHHSFLPHSFYKYVATAVVVGSSSKFFLRRIPECCQGSLSFIFIQIQDRNDGFWRQSHLATGRSVRSFDEHGRFGQLQPGNPKNTWRRCERSSLGPTH